MSKEIFKEDHKRSINLIGYRNLAVDMIHGLTNIVESIHHSVVDLAFNHTELEPPPKRKVSAFVYQGIRNVTHWSACALTPLLKALNHSLDKNEISPKQQALLSILNGIVGDHLYRSDNPLAIKMQFRINGKALSETELKILLEQSEGKILILVHGSCMNDLLWRHNDHDHGEKLALELGLTPIYLHYNSGLHISENGKQFSQLLESLNQSTKQPIDLSILAHSMGGLISRSACHYAEKENKSWQKRLGKLIFLGTPHHGAPLEKMGFWFEQLLKLNSVSSHFTKLTRLRGNGITDLRYGNIVDEDWQGQMALSGDQRQSIPLPQSVQCFSVAAASNKKANLFNDKLIGDGLVTVASALGKHKKEKYQLDFSAENQLTVRKVNHMELLSNSDVYLKIKSWLGHQTLPLT